MKRYHSETHILKRRAKIRRQLELFFYTDDNLPDTGRFRKSLRVAGCGGSSCQLCHPEKYPKRILTRKELQAKRDEREAFYDTADNVGANSG